MSQIGITVGPPSKDMTGSSTPSVSKTGVVL